MATQPPQQPPHQPQPSQGSQPPEIIRNRARKNPTVAILLGIFLPPLAYVYVGKWTWAIVNLVTLNFLLLGIIVVPIHTFKSIAAARAEVNEAEAQGARR